MYRARTNWNCSCVSLVRCATEPILDTATHWGAVEDQPLREYARLLRVVWRGIHHLRSLYRRGLSVDAVSAETGKSCGCQSQERVVHAGPPGRRTLRRRRRTIRLATLVDRSAFRTLRGQLCDSNVRDLYWFRFCERPRRRLSARARPPLHVPKTPAPPSRAALKTTLTIRLQAAERGQTAVKVLADPTPASARRAVHNCERRTGERSGKHSQRSTRSRGVAV